MIFCRHVVRASPEVVVPAIATIRTYLVRIILGLKVGIGLVLLTGLHIARIKSIH